MAFSYEEESKRVLEAIDIAIDSVRTYPPKGFQEVHLNQFIKTYSEIKYKILQPEPQFKNIKSLKHLTNDVFVFFQEYSGECVEQFWKVIDSKDLKFERENKLLKIIQKGKIANEIEYNYIIDTILPAEQSKMISKDQVLILNELIKKFEELWGDRFHPLRKLTNGGGGGKMRGPMAKNGQSPQSLSSLGTTERL